MIDPIRTITADAIEPERGDRFIQPLPGTDIAMMLAMMHVIIRDGLTDDEWIAAHTPVSTSCATPSPTGPRPAPPRRPASTPT